MKNMLLLSIIFAVFFISCKQKNSQPEKTVVKEPVQNKTQDSVEIRKTVIDFYTWYNGNYARFEHYDLYDGIKKKDAPPYKINWDVVKKYQAFIHDSVPDLGEEFLKNQRILFQKADSAFKVDVEDDVPYYFDFDWYTNTQEDPAFTLEDLKKSTHWTVTVKGDDATVDVKGVDEKGTNPPYNVANLLMKKEKGQWKIAKTWTD